MMSEPLPLLGSDLDPEQDVRLRVVEALLSRGIPPRHLDYEADRLVDYILNGRNESKPDGKIRKKLPVFLPGNDMSTPYSVKALAYIKDDNSLEVQFEDSEHLSAMWGLISEENLVALAFSYTRTLPEDDSKDD